MRQLSRIPRTVPNPVTLTRVNHIMYNENVTHLIFGKFMLRRTWVMFLQTKLR